MYGIEILIGKTIQSFELSDDKVIFSFIVSTEISDNIKLTFKCVGDCCSESWIEHFDEIPKDSLVTDVVEKDVTVIQEKSYNAETNEFLDCVQQYFYDIVTDKGIFCLELRNSSNGYYGGYIEKVYEDENR